MFHFTKWRQSCRYARITWAVVDDGVSQTNSGRFVYQGPLFFLKSLAITRHLRLSKVRIMRKDRSIDGLVDKWWLEAPLNFHNFCIMSPRNMCWYGIWKKISLRSFYKSYTALKNSKFGNFRTNLHFESSLKIHLRKKRLRPSENYCSLTEHRFEIFHSKFERDFKWTLRRFFYDY